MTLKLAISGALAPFLLAGSAWADVRATIPGAEPILPAGFTARSAASTLAAPPLFTPKHAAPRLFTTALQLGSLHTTLPGARPALPPRFMVALAPRAVMQRLEVRSAAAHALIDPRRLEALVPSPALWAGPKTVLWRTPLLDRAPSAAEKTSPLAGELIDAVARIEPIFDPTRLDGPEAVAPMSVSAGTASMDSVFGERWHRASVDPNINAKVSTIAMAWRRLRAASCADFVKARAHRPGAPALTALSEAECRDARRGSAADDTPVPIAIAQASVPVFAAPLPGSRLSSADFWAKRRDRIAEVQAELRERQAQQAMRVALGQL